MVYPVYCGSWPASEGGLTADLCVVDRVHIRCCGNGGLGFRPYGDLLFFQTGTCQGTCRLGLTVVSPLRP